ncbi:DUF3040 domain-containing protein [Dactylosporangium sp. NPDC049525]|uniref:DUF3040 domain-containing protein n=1 Tax=Dactylosporangium sp. NPDC049525 TaxID=3154730 RepID=UPI0034319B9B
MLDDDELWRLRQIEQQIAGDDPALARALSRFEPVVRWRFHVALGALLVALGGVPAVVMADAVALTVWVLAVLGVSGALLACVGVCSAQGWFGSG